MQFPTTWVAGGGIVGLLVVVFFLAVRLVVLLNHQLDRDRDLALSRDRCERKLSILVDIAIQHGWKFPEDFWEDPPHGG